MSDITVDLDTLRRRWAEQRAALAPILARIDTRGMTRPARDPEERAWLAERGESQFVEDEEIGRAAHAYYARKYYRPPT